MRQIFSNIRVFGICSAVFTLAISGSGALAPQTRGVDSKGPFQPQSADLRSPQARQIEPQIEEDIRGALAKNSQAGDFADWRFSGFTAAEVFQNFHSLSLAQPRVWKALCRSLEKLSAPDLAYFQNELASSANRGNLPCSQALLKRLGSFWASRLSEQNPQASRKVVSSRGIPVDPLNQPAVSAEMLRDREFALVLRDSSGAEDGHSKAALRLSSALAQLGVRAQFFFTGISAQDRLEAIREVAHQGHVVGAMPFSDAIVPSLEIQRAEDEIQDGANTVSQALRTPGGVKLFEFAADQGNFDTLARYLQAQGLTHVQVSLDSMDWKLRDPRALLAFDLAEIDRRHGGVIAFNIEYPQTEIVLPILVRELASRGYTAAVFVPTPRAEPVL